LLSKFASTKKLGSNKTFIRETIASPSITEEAVMMIIEAEDWRAPIIKYLQKDELPAAREEAYKVKKMSAWYSMLGDKLYKCQRFANLHYAPGEPLKSVLSPWPFFMWGTDILGPFPASTGQAK
jgi:hypothetical protein